MIRGIGSQTWPTTYRAVKPGRFQSHLLGANLCPWPHKLGGGRCTHQVRPLGSEITGALLQAFGSAGGQQGRYWCRDQRQIFVGLAQLACETSGRLVLCGLSCAPLHLHPNFAQSLRLAFLRRDRDMAPGTPLASAQATPATMSRLRRTPLLAPS